MKAAAAETVFRDTMLNEFLSVSRKIFREQFHRHVLRQRAADHRHAFDRASSSGSARNQVMAGNLSVGGFVAFSSLTAMAYGGILRTLGVWDNMQFANVLLNRLNDIFEQEPEQGRDRSQPHAGAQPGRPDRIARRQLSNMAGRKRRTF